MRQLLLVLTALVFGRGILLAIERMKQSPIVISDNVEIVMQLRKEVATLLQEVSVLRNSSNAEDHIVTPTPVADNTASLPQQLPLEILPPTPPPLPAPAAALTVHGAHLPGNGSLSNSGNANGRFCYCSMMANCDNRYKYRVYLSGILVFTARLRALGSKADMVVLVNFAADGGLAALPAEDLARLAEWDIKLKYVDSVWGRFLSDTNIHDSERAKEKSVMYNKIFAWEMVEYDLVQYVDADVMPIQNMDAYFQRRRTTFTRGWMSPLQGAWYLLKPDPSTFRDLSALVKHRYSERWDPKKSFDVDGDQPSDKGPCLDDDQGLFWCYFRYAKKSPPMDYVDHKNTRLNSVQTIQRGKVTSTERSKGSFRFLFEHFGGRFKPWRVCSEPSTFRNLRSIANQHAHHWPPTKYESFQVYCKIFLEYKLDTFVRSVVSPIKKG